ncbi:MAG: DUF6206 family protein [Actinomycetota bacterium]
MISAEDLAELEALVGDALDRQDTSALRVLGYGEISMALGWPVDEPTVVCKRTPPFSPAQFTHYAELVQSYMDGLAASGLRIAPTEIRPLERGNRVVAYLVQPLLDPATLGHQVLAASIPDPEHPFLEALAATLTLATPELSFDAQVTNFAWDGADLTLVDIGTPFVWSAEGALQFDMGPFVRPLPAVVRPLVVREMTGMLNRWREPRSVALDVAANLYREGLDGWVEPTLAAFNRELAFEQPLAVEEADALYREDVRIWPVLKRLQAAERWWLTTIRRRPYDFFIHSTFSD